MENTEAYVKLERNMRGLRGELDNPEAYVKWLREPTPIHRLAVIFESSNTSSEKAFFNVDSLCQNLDSMGLEVRRPSLFGRLSRKRLFQSSDALLRIRYNQHLSSIGYQKTSGRRNSGAWITKEEAPKVYSSSSSFDHAVEAEVAFSVETQDGVLFQGGGHNKTFPASLPTWLSAREVHHRAMREAEDFLMGSINVIAPCAGAPALKLLVRYGEYQKLALTALSESTSIADCISDLLSKSPETILKDYWQVWPDGIRDNIPDVRENVVNILRNPVALVMMEGGTVGLYGNYPIAELAQRNISIAETLRYLSASSNTPVSLRACSILAINGDTLAEKHLIDLARSSDWKTKEMAVWNIVRYGTEPLLRRASIDIDPGVRRLFQLSVCTFSEVFDLTSRDGVVSTDAAVWNFYRLLQGPFCMDEGRQLLLLHLAANALEQDESDGVRQAAAKALVVLWMDEPAGPQLVECLARIAATDSNVGVRQEVLKSLEDIRER